MKKKMLFSLLAAAVVMLGVVPAVHADTLAFYISTTGPTTGYNTTALLSCSAPASPCAGTSIASGSLLFSILSGTSNVPGSAGNANTSGSTLTVKNSGGSTATFWLLEMVSTFTAPSTPSVFLSAQETFLQGDGSIQATGYLNGSLSGAGAFSGSTCSVADITLTGIGSNGPNSTACSNSPQFTSMAIVTAYTVAPTFADGSNALSAQENINVSPVPEPASMLLFGTGLVGIAGAIRRRFAK